MDIVTAQFPAMASHCEVTLVAEDETKAKQAIELASNEIRRIEHKYSRYRPDSLISQINLAAGTGQRTLIDPETAWLLSYANALYQDSDGLFDITSGKLSRAWDFTKRLVPTEAELETLCSLVNWSAVEASDTHIYLPKVGMEIDFGGFGKEYAVDRAAEILRAAGFLHGFVNFGGDVRVLGPQPDNSPWQIGIRDPNQATGLIASIPMHGGGLATSGDYERFFELDGQRYTHIIHPKTGMPVGFSRSISVIADTALHAGSCSTVAMLMENPESFLTLYPVRYLIVAPDGTITQK
jgi:FAD:protein FMN transferase